MADNFAFQSYILILQNKNDESIDRLQKMIDSDDLSLMDKVALIDIQLALRIDKNTINHLNEINADLMDRMETLVTKYTEAVSEI